MDLGPIIQQLLQGNNPLLIILAVAFFLFKDQIFKPTPAPTPDPGPGPAPVPTPVPTPAPGPDRPVIDAIVNQILPMILPVIIKIITDQVKLSKQEQHQ